MIRKEGAAGRELEHLLAQAGLGEAWLDTTPLRITWLHGTATSIASRSDVRSRGSYCVDRSDCAHLQSNVVATHKQHRISAPDAILGVR